MQNIDTTAINAPKNTAHAIPSTAISKEPIEPSDDEFELSVDRSAMDDDAEDPELFSEGDNNVCAPALTSNNP